MTFWVGFKFTKVSINCFFANFLETHSNIDLKLFKDESRFHKNYWFLIQFLGLGSPFDLIKPSSNPLGWEGVFPYGACVASHTDTLSSGSPAQSELTSMARWWRNSPWWQWAGPGGNGGPDRFRGSLEAARGPETGSPWWVQTPPCLLLAPSPAENGHLVHPSAGLPGGRRWWWRWRAVIP